MLDQEKIWEISECKREVINKLTKKLDISQIMARILANRDLKTPQQVEEFLDFSLEELNDPFLLKGMKQAISRIDQAINNEEKIIIYGDYDVDGISSTSLLITVLTELGGEVDYYIPNRLKEGYGMNKEAINKINNRQADLIITVDCGITAVEEVELAQKLGIDVIITDHHTVPEEIPPAVAIINPKQEDCFYPFKELAGIGVAFKLVQALLYSLEGISDNTKLTKYISLVAVGTIADIVPLIGENRIIVKQGLKRINSFQGAGDFNLGILKSKIGYENKEITSGQIGYYLAPCINAAGRLGKAELGVGIFTESNFKKADDLAAKLRKMNIERQDITSDILAQAEEYIAREIDLETERVLVITLEEGHSGVIGNAASKIQEKYHRPVLLITFDDKGLGVGSARSISNFNLYQSFQYCADCFEDFGGHKEAAGFSIIEENISKLRKMINEYAYQVLDEEDLKYRIKIDQLISFEDASEELIEELKVLEPFGFANPRPKFATKGLTVEDFRVFGRSRDHIKINFTKEGKALEALGWGGASLRKDLLVEKEDINLAFTLDINEFRGERNLNLVLKDIKFPKKTFVDRLFAKKDKILEDDFYRGIGEAEQFYTKAVGVTFNNRQEIIKDLVKGDPLSLVREPDNQYDRWAIKLLDKTGGQIGYLNSNLAKHLAPYIDAGIGYEAIVSEVTGGGDKNFGVNIFIKQKESGQNKTENNELNLHRAQLATKSISQILDEIRNSLIGEYNFRPKQQEAINSLMQDYNTLAIFGTGRGKSAVFQTFAALQAIKFGQMTVILYPLRALVNDQYQALEEKLSPLGLKIYKGNGALNLQEREELNQALRENEVDILLTTPEFIEYNLNRFREIRNRIGFFVVDESHHIGLASKTFRPTYKRIPKLLKALNNPLVLAVTATANDEVAQDIVDYLGIEKLVIDTYIRENLKLVDKRNYSNKEDYINNLIQDGEKSIIYVNSRKKSIDLASNLRENNPFLAQQIAFYNAGLTNQERNLVEEKFREGEIKIVVSTSAFGEGVDIPDIRHIVLYHLTFNRTEFNQQSGRAGRDGNLAYIHLLYGRQDARINEFILNNIAPNRDVLAKLYITLRELQVENEEIVITNQELADKINKTSKLEVQASTVSAGLGILEELKLIVRIKEGERVIQLSPKPKQKLDLTTSIRYNEGVQDKKAFKEFKKFALDEEADKLLNLINQPIYPTKSIRLKGEKKIEFSR